MEAGELGPDCDGRCGELDSGAGIDCDGVCDAADAASSPDCVDPCIDDPALPECNPADGGPADPPTPAPVMPPIEVECPSWQDGQITFMGLGEIQLAVGPRASEPSAPMVFYWHGTASSSNEFAVLAPEVHAGVIAEGEDVVVVDFSQTSATANEGFSARGGFVVTCDHGGRHCGGASLAGDIWTFFQAHPYGVTPRPWANGLPAGLDPACVIY